MSTEQPVQTLAVFILDDGKAAKSFLKVVQKIDDADKTVKIVDAAIADKSGKGKVKIHQTEEASGLKGALKGAALGVVVGAIVVAGTPLAWGVAGGILAGLRNRFRDIGIDDKFMQRTAAEIDKGKSALFVLYEGDWSNSIGAIEDAIRANGALLIQSTLPPEAAAELRALVEPAAEELGGEEVVADFEVETAPEPEEAAAAAEAAPAITEAEPDDLTKVSGIGPKASAVLVAGGIASYHDLAGTSEPALRGVFSDAHTAVPRSVGTWAMQASFAERGDWAGLKAFNKQTQPAAAKAAAAAPAEPDDLTNLAGIGPKAAKALAGGGITTYAALAEAGEPTLRKALHAADMTAPSNVGTWPMQADYALRGDWRGLARYNARGSKAAAPRATAAPAAAAAAPAAKADDLTQLAGIGPRIATLLAEGGVTGYAALSHLSSEELREIISAGGALPPSSLESWPTQAGYAAKGDWNGLAEYNKRHQA